MAIDISVSDAMVALHIWITILHGPLNVISVSEAMVALHIWITILHSPLNVGCIVDMLGTSVPGINMHSMFMCLICVQLAP